MKRYMGHFGESVNPNSVLAKINELDVLISENNVTLKSLEDNIESLKKSIQENENVLASIKPMTDRLIKLRDYAQSRINNYKCAARTRPGSKARQSCSASNPVLPVP